MKNSSWIILLITCLLLGFMAGLFVGQHQIDGTITAQVQRKDPVDKIDLNHATIEQLCVVPGISHITAQRIIDYRESYGPFRSVDELCNIYGISEYKLEQFSRYVTVGDGS